MTASFDPGQPHHGAELRAALARLVRAGHEHLGALPDAEFFAPQGDRWSPAEHVRHLRKSTSPVARAFKLPAWVLRLRFGRGHAPSRDFVTLRDTYRGVLAAGGQAGRFAPAPEAVPGDTASRRAAIMQAWAKAARELDAASSGWTDAALERAWLPHPLLGLLTAREMLAFTVYHTSHHLALVAARLARVS